MATVSLPRILSCASVAPAHRYPTAEIVPYIRRWLEGQGDLGARIEGIIRSCDIDERGCVLPLEETFRRRTFEEKNNLFIEQALEMGSLALGRALLAAGAEPKEIDFIISIGCTGYMIPSLDAHLINRFGMRRDVQRLPVLQMGCAGGTSAIMYAADFLRAHPGKKVAIVSVELPSLTLQLDDLSMANLVSTAIFADGAAAAILGNGPEPGPEICDNAMYNFPDATWLMGYSLRNSGFHIVLDRRVPEMIAQHFDAIVLPFLERNSIGFEQIRHFVFHPGSIRILEKAEALVRDHGGDLEASKAVLRAHGNMSSATVLFILERALAQGQAGDHGLMLGFGPGFVGQTVLLRWPSANGFSGGARG